jgi:hydrogenase expression/formation protein HypC
MCLAIPSRVIELDGELAVVECFGVTRRVSLMLMNEPLALGDYVLIQAGGFAYERVAPDSARAALELMGRVIAQGV